MIGREEQATKRINGYHSLVLNHLLQNNVCHLKIKCQVHNEVICAPTAKVMSIYRSKIPLWNTVQLPTYDW